MLLLGDLDDNDDAMPCDVAHALDENDDVLPHAVAHAHAHDEYDEYDDDEDFFLRMDCRSVLDVQVHSSLRVVIASFRLLK